MWASEILLRMKEQTAYQDVELCLALPFEGYDADWDDWHRKRMKFIRKYAAKVLILGEMPSSENYKNAIALWWIRPAVWWLFMIM